MGAAYPCLPAEYIRLHTSELRLCQVVTVHLSTVGEIGWRDGAALLTVAGNYVGSVRQGSHPGCPAVACNVCSGFSGDRQQSSNQRYRAVGFRSICGNRRQRLDLNGNLPHLKVAFV